MVGGKREIVHSSSLLAAPELMAHPVLWNLGFVSQSPCV